MTPKKDTGLIAYWLSFPDNPGFPIGLGVTARSIEDAHRLLEEKGYNFHRRARRVKTQEGVTIDELDATNVTVNMGPISARGVWYPCHNS